jgi:hypothetical protein
LILSYILHGHIPYYTGKHHDALLDSKLRKLESLLRIDSEVYAHFGSSLRYSQQAQPINALLDTLVRPNADTEIDPPSHIEWRHEPQREVSHIVLTDSQRPGGQWTRDSGSKSDEIGTLSYAEMLSLPGYSFKEHYRRQHGVSPPELMRPSRTLVASYYASYPKAVGISSSIRTNTNISRISRASDGFVIEPVYIKCKKLVLATGIFTHAIAPPPMLAPIQHISVPCLPLLVIGSGFSAADAIISAAPQQKIIHLFKWDPANHPSPLRGCHHQAYPEYAGVYRQMKAAANQHAQVVSPMSRRKTNPFFTQRDWTTVYEGLPNATIDKLYPVDNGYGIVITVKNGTSVERVVGSLAYHVGRRGSLAYLDPALLDEVLGESARAENTENDSTLLRRGGTRNGGATVAKDVYAIGSLTGDSLVRHAFGVCVDAAGRIMVGEQQQVNGCTRTTTNGISNDWSSECGAKSLVNGVEHGERPLTPRIDGWTHDDLHIDRRELLTNGH